MDCRWLLCLVGFAVAGCVSSGAADMPAKPPMGEDSPFAGLPPIHQSINDEVNQPLLATQGTKPANSPTGRKVDPSAPQDAGTQKASTTPEPLPIPETRPMSLPDPGARPAPFANEKQGSPRPQSTAGSAGTAGRAAPYADSQPTAPRPQVVPASNAAPRPTANPNPAANAPPAISTAPAPMVEPPRLPDTNPPSAATSPPATPPGTLGALNAPPVLPSASPPVDPALVQTSGTQRRARNDFALGDGAAATVGDEIITVYQLRSAYREKLDLIPAQQRTPEIKELVLKNVLDNMIDRALIMAAAKRQMKDPKNLKGFYDAIEKHWVEHELPPLLKQYHAANLTELKAKLAEKGKSYDDLHNDFREDTLAHEYLSMKMKDRLSVSLHDMLVYYDKNMHKYDRPEAIIWREIVVDLAKQPSRAAAKAKAEEILERLRRGEDFARLAKKESNGPTAKDGGRWETSPNSYGIPSVNDALNRIPVNQISQVIEAPLGFHIIKVEQRRPAGPARFDEVQDQVRAAVAEQKRRDAATKYIATLRERTVIRIMLDKQPTSDPATLKVGATTPASNQPPNR